MTDTENPSEEESNPSEEEPLFRFDDLSSPLRENVAALGWDAPMPVQETVIPHLVKGRDVVVQSRTGSGKTGAFLLPMLQRVDPRRDECQGLVLVPTRELAEQVHQVLVALIKKTKIRSVVVYGGVGYGPQVDAFKNKVHIVVATPGRMIDHLTGGRVSLSKLRLIVLDEGDEMLSMGFYESITRILSFLPKKRQTALFSATIPPGVAVLAERFSRDPMRISLSSDIMHVEEVEHVYYVEDAMYKDRALLKIVEMENPEAALIFCNTKREVEYLGTFLRNFGYDGDFLSGDLSQAERERVMTRIREGKLRFLVATDVAARGIDISELGYVFLYNLPQAHDHYIHRAGRTGRAGEAGIAISLVTPLEEMELERRAKQTNLKLTRKEIPTDEEVEAKVAERLRVMLEEKYRYLSNLEKERLTRFVPMVNNLVEGGAPPEVVAMLFDQFYQDSLHRPQYPREEKLEKKERAPSRQSRSDRGGGKSRGRSSGGRSSGGRSGGGRSGGGRSGGSGGGRGGSSRNRRQK